MTATRSPPRPNFAALGRGRAVALADLHADGPALLLFVSEECPTCALTLRRLAPFVSSWRAPACAWPRCSRIRSRSLPEWHGGPGSSGVVLSEPAPYDVSRAYSLQSLPTAVLVDRSGRETGRVVGWDSDGLAALLSVSGTDEPPLRKPGCAAKSTYDADALRLLDGAGYDELEEMFERGWTDGLPVIPPTPERVQAMLRRPRPVSAARRDPAGDGEGDAGARRRVCGARGMPTRLLPGRGGGGRGCFGAGVQRRRAGGHHAACGQVIVVNGPVRDAIGLNGAIGALGPGWRANMTDRAGAAARGQPDRRRLTRPPRPLDARQPGQDRAVLR